MRRLLWLFLLAAAPLWADRADMMQDVTRLRSAGEGIAAAAALGDWLEEHPRDADARLLLGQVLADSGDDDGAVRQWRALLQQRPVQVQHFEVVANRLQGLGRTEEAIEVLRDGARSLGGADPFAWQRAEMELGLGDVDGAVASHRALLRQEPHRRPLVENRLAVLARQDPQGRGRVDAYRRALAMVLDDATADEASHLRLLYAAVALESGDAMAGLEALVEQVEHDAGMVQQLFQYAHRCAAADETAAAGYAFGAFVRHSPGSPYADRARLQQAEMWALSGQVEEAVALYEELAVDSTAESAEAMLRVARLQTEQLGDPQAALRTLDLLGGRLARGDRWRRSVALRAEAYLHLDDLDGAAAQWERLLDGEERPAAEFGLAQLAFYRGDFAAATARADSLVRRQPSHPLANDALDLLLLIEAHADAPALAVLARAQLHQRQGQDDEAQRLRDQVAAGGSADLRHLAWLRSAEAAQERDPQTALAFYEKVAGDDPDEHHAVTAALGRARLLEDSGDRATALRTYETAVLTAPLDPRAPEIRRQIARLRQSLEVSG
jgi:tetratricopeptide (TPR) repeat protein